MFDDETGSFSGLFGFDAPFDPNYDGYTWNLQVGAGVSADTGVANALLGSTIALKSVTLADGTPIAASDLSIDSGLELSAVPEPSSLLNGFIGALCVGGVTWLRQKRGASGYRFV